MRLWRVLAAGALGALPLLVFAAPAGASLDGPCEASGDLDGTHYEAATTDEAEIPAESEVAWEGSVPGDGTSQRDISGFVKVDFPAPIPDPEIGNWDGPSSLYANADVYDYELPSVLEGFDIKVFGEHHEPGIDCAGEVTVRLEGGGIGNPLTLAALAFTVIAIVNVSLAVGVL